LNPSSYRLPTTVLPRRYDLTLEPDLGDASFAGSVVIDVEVSEEVEHIVVHALDLEIDRAELRHGDLEARTLLVELDAVAETATLRPADGGVIPTGDAVLSVDFTGTLNDQLVGFYRSTFRDDAGDEHRLAVTQFESTHARRAFPCFDEPAMKAVFAITVVVDPALLVVSNAGEIERVERADGRAAVRFADTMPMSTYLVAVVVGPLEVTAVREVTGMGATIPLRVVHPPGQGHLSGFALDVAEAALTFFEAYYDLPYPGDKVDLVAVPDFAFGAMENLGCITFREVLLLIDPQRATQPELQRVADVINHELAHMWFGDLVTMSWWNGIWLNEAFATFMEITATDSFRPDWDVWTTFGLARAAAFDTDTLRSTRPIEYEVVSAADAEGMFDILTYEKGASVVRMLEQYLGAAAFRDGIRSYLRTHAYGNTETTDLWDALEASTGEPVRRIMDEWIFRGGHPVVGVESTPEGLRLDQRRAGFLPESGDDPPWPTPLVLSASASQQRGEPRRLLLDEELEVDLGAPAALVQANVGGNGFYRVELAPELRLALAGDPDATPLERFVLVDDTWSSLLAGRTTVGEAVDLFTHLMPDERDTSVWRRVAGALGELRRLVGRGGIATIEELIRGLARPVLAELDAAIEANGATTGVGPIGDDDGTAKCRELRGVLFALAGRDGADAEVRQRARGLLLDDGDPALRAAATEVVAASATTEEHQELEHRWRAATTPQEELRLLNALIDTPDADCFAHTLELTLSDVRTQNAPYLLRRGIAHPTLGPAAWDFVESGWSQVVERFPSNSLPRMLEGVRGITDRPTAERIERFLAGIELPSGGRSVAQHVERMWVGVVAAGRVRAELTSAPGDDA